MIRLIFSGVIIVHGLIHILGFVKEWNLAPVSKLSGKTLIAITGITAKITGALWLLTALMFITTALLYLMQKEWYWLPCFLAVIVSQTLIIIYWHDARYGTIANVIILAGLILAFAASRFERVSKSEIAEIIGQASTTPEAVDDKSIQHLPGIVKKWLNRSNVIGASQPVVIHLKQKGMMRSNPEEKWMPFDAEQYFTIEPPAFIWSAKIHTQVYSI